MLISGAFVSFKYGLDGEAFFSKFGEVHFDFHHINKHLFSQMRTKITCT